MKKILLLAVLAVFPVIQSCEGPEGPQGPAGQDGLLAEVFEVNATFVDDADPYFAYREFYDLDPAIYASDNVLVYELSGVESGLDVWKLLPQVYTFDQGIMQYNYDFTTNDFSIFIDANFDRSQLGSAWTNNKVFRIVIVPGYFSGDLSRRANPTYEQITSQYNLTEADVKSLQPKS